MARFSIRSCYKLDQTLFDIPVLAFVSINSETCVLPNHLHPVNFGDLAAGESFTLRVIKELIVRKCMKRESKFKMSLKRLYKGIVFIDFIGYLQLTKISIRFILLYDFWEPQNVSYL